MPLMKKNIPFKESKSQSFDFVVLFYIENIFSKPRLIAMCLLSIFPENALVPNP